jgi:L,D-peptidoglycan transpeptidase YkuD (ErfK/YbiS/YcfS/YnhG family)
MRRGIGVLPLLAALLAGCAAHPDRPTTAPIPASTTAPAASTTVPVPASTTVPAARPTPPPPTTPARPTAAPLLVERMADTRGAQQLITVTEAGLQAFERVGTRWRLVLGPLPAVIGAQGFSHAVSESTTATPIGLFTLTQAFGTAADPGTRLPYRRTRYGDVWVDEPTAATYNTLQPDDADFARGSGERLWRETTAYEYALVIDYNRRPVRPGAGSAFFLHVTIPVPSQGCVTVRRDLLIRLLRWLDPARRPAIALGPTAEVITL